MTTCKNCGLEIQSKFCPDCGQKAKTGRITLRHVAQEARQHFIDFDQGFLYTIKELALRPGHSIRGYLEGRRVQYVKPLKFIFWTLAISFLAFHYTGLDTQMLQQMEKDQGLQSRPQDGLLAQKLVLLMTTNPAVVAFTLIPLIALCSWLLFRRRSYNYAEHFILSVYLMGELSLASVITSPLARAVNGDNYSTWVTVVPSLLLWVIYFGWAYGQFFQSHRFGVYFKSILAALLGYLLMIIFTGILVSIIVFFFRPQLETWLPQ